MDLSIRLFEPQQANQALRGVWKTIKPHLMAEHRFVLTVKPETRSGEQNRLLHAAIGDVAEQVEWAGRKQDIETWKRLLTAAWCRARGEPVSILPAIDGHGIDIVFRRTSTLTKAECSELVEFIHAWGTEHGVKSRAPEECE